jgi:ATP diphosphatase
MADDIERLLEIMARLRDPDGGCPWDLEQDFSTISPHTIEEAYEVDEAIASGDAASLRDELGDLLFQVVFQARIAEEKGLFDFGDVVRAIAEKLVRRHPHVFADAATPASAEEQVAHWEAIKAEERAQAGRSRERPADPFAGIPRRLPALARSAKLVGRFERLPPEARPAGAAEVAPPPRRALVSALEEATEAARDLIGSAPAGRPAGSPERAAVLRGVGEGLRAWVWLARELGIDPEQALRHVDDEAIDAVRAHSPAKSP